MTKVYLEADEISRLAEAASNLRDRLLVMLLFQLGCRISEALALKVEDFDLKNRTVMIVRLKSHVSLACPKYGTRLSQSHRYCAKCGAETDEASRKLSEVRKQRILPMSAQACQMIEDYVRRNGPVRKNGVNLLFGINRHRAWQIFQECTERAGLPKLLNPETGKVHSVSPHRLRDAFAVNAVKHNDSGDGLRMLQEHLGHQSFNTTARYRKVAGEELRRWYEGLWKDDKA